MHDTLPDGIGTVPPSPGEKNYGINWAKEIAEQSEEDWEFGADSSLCIGLIPEDEREKYLPVGEVQKGKGDFMDCATRSPINTLETKFNALYQDDHLLPANRKWLQDSGYVEDGRITFSDRFIAILSGTDKQGNSLKAPCHAIHTYGLIPKKMLPANKSMRFEDYHKKSDITEEMKELGQEFLERFPINYERVRDVDFDVVIGEDMIGVAGYAWPKPKANGEYPQTGKSPNHAFLYFADRYTIFDNYIDKHDGDFIKKLARNYSLVGYGYRVFISAENLPNDKSSIIDELKRLLRIGDLTTFWSVLRANFSSWLGGKRS